MQGNDALADELAAVRATLGLAMATLEMVLSPRCTEEQYAHAKRLLAAWKSTNGGNA